MDVCCRLSGIQQKTEELTKSCVELGAEDKGASYGNIQKEADDEWGKTAI
jgi:hypothetical protein